MKQISKFEKSLKDIAPNWYEYLKSGLKGKPGLHMGDHACCIVGEAHGFNGNYECAECYRIAMRFYFAYTHDPPLNDLFARTAYNWHGQSFDVVKKEFLDHWNLKHVKDQAA